MTSLASLPANCPPRVLRRAQAAEYLAVSMTTLDGLVKSGAIPPPIRFGARIGYDRHALDRYIDAQSPAPDDGANPFD